MEFNDVEHSLEWKTCGCTMLAKSSSFDGRGEDHTSKHGLHFHLMLELHNRKRYICSLISSIILRSFQSFNLRTVQVRPVIPVCNSSTSIPRRCSPGTHRRSGSALVSGTSIMWEVLVVLALCRRRQIGTLSVEVVLADPAVVGGCVLIVPACIACELSPGKGRKRSQCSGCDPWWIVLIGCRCLPLPVNAFDASTPPPHNWNAGTMACWRLARGCQE